MQVLIQVISKGDKSLRSAITSDRQLGKYQFEVAEHKRQHRDNGWAKLHSTEPAIRGAINIEWDANAKILLCRVVNKGRAKPDDIIGDFLRYLFARHRPRIQAINIIP